MVKRRKSKKKTTRKKTQKKTKEKSKLEVLKEKQSLLFSRVEENAKVIMNSCKITREEYDQVIQKYGYEAFETLDNFDIIDPIWDQMKELYQVYSEISEYVERLKVLESKSLIHDTKKMVEELEQEIAQKEKEDSYYTEEPDKDGIIKMKEKWKIEKDYWENRKNKFEKYLNSENVEKLSEEDKAKMEAELEEAKTQLSILNKKKRWATAKNIQPNISKVTKKISEVITGVQDSIQEVTKPFAEMGDTYGGKQKLPDYEKMFSSRNDQNIGKNFENMFTEPKRKGKKSKKDDLTNWENYFG